MFPMIEFTRISAALAGAPYIRINASGCALLRNAEAGLSRRSQKPAVPRNGYGHMHFHCRIFLEINTYKQYLFPKYGETLRSVNRSKRYHPRQAGERVRFGIVPGP
jgi:hypothetical protein